jgi:hypothetical protein
MKASTQWHDPGLFAVHISMLRSDIRFNRFICGGSLYTDRLPDMAVSVLAGQQTVADGPTRISEIGAKKPINLGLRNEAF